MNDNPDSHGHPLGSSNANPPGEGENDTARKKRSQTTAIVTRRSGRRSGVEPPQFFQIVDRYWHNQEKAVARQRQKREEMKKASDSVDSSVSEASIPKAVIPETVPTTALSRTTTPPQLKEPTANPNKQAEPLSKATTKLGTAETPSEESPMEGSTPPPMPAQGKKPSAPIESTMPPLAVGSSGTSRAFSVDVDESDHRPDELDNDKVREPKVESREHEATKLVALHDSGKSVKVGVYYSKNEIAAPAERQEGKTPASTAVESTDNNDQHQTGKTGTATTKQAEFSENTTTDEEPGVKRAQGKNGHIETEAWGKRAHGRIENQVPDPVSSLDLSTEEVHEEHPKNLQAKDHASFEQEEDTAATRRSRRTRRPVVFNVDEYLTALARNEEFLQLATTEDESYRKKSRRKGSDKSARPRTSSGVASAKRRKLPKSKSPSAALDEEYTMRKPTPPSFENDTRARLAQSRPGRTRGDVSTERQQYKRFKAQVRDENGLAPIMRQLLQQEIQHEIDAAVSAFAQLARVCGPLP